MLISYQAAIGHEAGPYQKPLLQGSQPGELQGAGHCTHVAGPRDTNHGTMHSSCYSIRVVGPRDLAADYGELRAGRPSEAEHGSPPTSMPPLLNLLQLKPRAVCPPRRSPCSIVTTISAVIMIWVLSFVIVISTVSIPPHPPTPPSEEPHDLFFKLHRLQDLVFDAIVTTPSRGEIALSLTWTMNGAMRIFER